jgi:hypothetical protein
VPRGALGRAWAGLGSAWWIRDKSEFPFCGETTLRAKRCAARSYRRLRSCPSLPPWVWAHLPTVSSAGDGGPPGAPCFLARRRYLRPSPTALHCYRAPRREDKSDTEETQQSLNRHRTGVRTFSVVSVTIVLDHVHDRTSPPPEAGEHQGRAGVRVEAEEQSRGQEVQKSESKTRSPKPPYGKVFKVKYLTRL